MSVPQRWPKMSLLCLFPWHVPSHVVNLLSLPSPGLFIWHLGSGGQTWHMESQEFRPWVQNSGLNIWIFFKTEQCLVYFNITEMTSLDVNINNTFLIFKKTSISKQKNYIEKSGIILLFCKSLFWLHRRKLDTPICFYTIFITMLHGM
jgi:hypothetical protein